MQSTNGAPIVAERPVYFSYTGAWTGGHDVVGAAAPARRFYFAEGTARPDFDPYFCIQNPTQFDALVNITFYLGDGQTKEHGILVRPTSRETVVIKDVLGSADDVAHDLAFGAAPEVVAAQREEVRDVERVADHRDTARHRDAAGRERTGFVDALDRGEEMPHTALADAARTHEAIFAADRSAETGRPVNL